MTIEELEQIAKNVKQENEKYDYEVNVCMDLACASQGAGRAERCAGEGRRSLRQESAACAAPAAWDPARMGRWCASIPRRRSTTT